MRVKLRIGITLKLFKNGQEVYSVVKTIKDRIIDEALVRLWDRAYIKVSYNSKFSNKGEYTNLEDLKDALSAFTSKSTLSILN